MERSMRPKGRKDNKGMSPKELEDSTSSPGGLNMEDRAELEKMSKIRRAKARSGRERAMMADDPRLPGAAERKAADKKGLQDLLGMMDEPVKKAYGGKMKKPVAMSYGGKTPKKMGMGGGTGKCRGMGAATRGGNFKMG